MWAGSGEGRVGSLLSGGSGVVGCCCMVLLSESMYRCILLMALKASLGGDSFLI